MHKPLRLGFDTHNILTYGNMLLVAIAVFLVSATVYVSNTGENYAHQAQQHALELSASAAALIPGDRVEQIDGENDAYWYAKNALMELDAQNTEVYSAYLCTSTGDGSILLLADSEPSGSPGCEIPEDALSAVNRAFIGEKTVISPADSRHTRLMTFVPIHDKASGEIAAVLGIEYDASYWQREVHRHVINAIVVSVCMLLLLIGFYWEINQNKKLKILGEKLQASESLFRTIFEQAPIGICIERDDRLISHINPMLEKVLARSKEELLSIKWTEYTHPDDLEEDLTLSHRFKQGEIPGYTVQKRYIRADGTAVWAKKTVTPLQLGLSEYSGANLCLIEDISDRVQAEKALKESERSKAVLLSHMPGMAYRCEYDEEWTMLFVSDGCFEITGYPPESLLHNRAVSYNDLIAPEYRETIRHEWERVLADKRPFRYEYKIIPASGNRKWVLEMGQGIFDEEGKVEALEGIIIDITEQKMREAQIQYMSDHDYMTGLYNRRYFEEVKASMDSVDNLPLSVIVADINGIRLINDAFGLSEGDRVIVEIAYVLKGCCRKEDVLARTGANEFSILMPNTDDEQVSKMILKIKRAVESYNRTIDDRTYDISLSIGHATKTDQGENINHVVKAAEDYLHNRKLLDRRSSHSTLLSSIMATMFERSQETEEHAERIAVLSKMIGDRLGLPQRSLNELELLSMLHDIGKVGIDDSILNKPGKLNRSEWKAMQRHPEIGYRIAMTSPELEPIAEYILSHHERWDGTGYPRGLKGEEIPLLARILAVVDAYDAMTEDRVYRKALTVGEAIEEIRRNAGTQFDPEIARIFIECLTG